jgi:iron complex transport system substrate-binding protein
MTLGSRRLACVLAATLFLGGVTGAHAKPARVVSLNVCTDQLLLLLAERPRIASVSFLARDPAASAMAEEAKGLHVNYGRAEEVLPLSPDLVLAGRAAARTTVGILKRLGHRVVELPLATRLGDVPRQLGIVARALGEDKKGATLIARFEARLTTLTQRTTIASGETRPTVLLIGPNGFSAGRASLPGAVIAAAGFDNVADGLGIAGIGRIPLEHVLAARPAAVIFGRLAVETPSLADGVLDHPALQSMVGGLPVAHIAHHGWSCAIPGILDTFAQLTELRGRMVGRAASGSWP